MQALRCAVGGREELAQVPRMFQGHITGQGMGGLSEGSLAAWLFWRLSQIWLSCAKQLLGCFGSGQAEDKQNHPQSSGGDSYPKVNL